MSYTALYRKFRPQEFEDVKGQEHIVTTLKNQIKTNRIGHAYLFTGTRGTGKTTIAKIFAKAINCEHPIEGSPCNECEMCKGIQSQSSMNVIEIDAASNNGVSNIRDIIQEVGYAPTEGKYKVYIIDEVHMLSIGAFNALLKTLEEPPEYVVFILATTEVHKIPITILSRCQRYDFRRISMDTITDRLKELMEEEQVEVEEKALRYIAKVADGSMRDALSLLDQCIAFHLGEKLTYDHVLQVLGAVDTEVFSALLQGLGKKEIIKTIEILEEMVVQGRDLGQFVIDFTWYLRNLLLVQSGPTMEDVLEVTSEQFQLLQQEAKTISSEGLIRYIQIFSALSNQLKDSTQKRVLIEIAFVKICRPQMETNIEGLLQRIEDLEEKMNQGIPMIPQQIDNSTVNSMPQKVEQQKLPKALPEEIQELAKNWKSVVASAQGLLQASLTYISTVTVSPQGDLMFVFDQNDKSRDIGGTYIQEHLDEVKSFLEEKVGKEIPVIVEFNDSSISSKRLYEDVVEQFAKSHNIEIKEEDF